MATQINFSNITPAAPSGNVNVTWQTDGNGNLSAYVSSTSGSSGFNPYSNSPVSNPPNPSTLAWYESSCF